jgi:peroxiredoxin
MAVSVTPARLGVKAPDFRLPATDGKTYAFADIAGQKGTVVVFICNHCPYVKAVIGRLVAEAKVLSGEGIGVAAISSNDAVDYAEDSFPNMKRFAERHGLPFPYLYDESQAIAHAYDAVCTPDFFGISAAGLIEYRGRLDEGRRDQPPPGARRELVEAMRLIAATGKGPKDQVPSVGCSMKWKHAA